ncbi:hypothetical protein J2S70_000961 [Trueperella bonasi]|uniref:DUF4825 domain-containing protein n=1 Tax=Trueperella bonasi TaxID=312286 RepID=A0ABT9NG48_9ACTO|nr:DUF4825 domain-containing protein [Trueperella bonasi]MDP9806379.1 hypothetical protein [Trueperella bonasi]
MPAYKKTTVIPQALIALGLTLIVIVGMSMARANAIAETTGEKFVTYENHDLATIGDYTSEFVGDNANTVQLLHALPLGDRIDRVEIHETDVDVILSEDTKAEWLDERNDALYSAIALFASVDNATGVTFYSPSAQYSVSRRSVDDRFGAPLSDLLESADAWQWVRTLIPIESEALVLTDEQ